MPRRPAGTAGLTVYIENYAQVRRDLARYAPDLGIAMREEIRGVAQRTAVPAIRQRIPRSTGAATKRSGATEHAQDSVKVTPKGDVTWIIGGSEAAPHFGWLDFGGTLKPSGGRRNTISRPFIKTGRYVYPGFASTRPEFIQGVTRSCDRTTNNLGFGAGNLTGGTRF